MKTLFSKGYIAAIALVAILSQSFTVVNTTNKEKDPIPVELKYRGMLKDQPCFELLFNNAEESKFNITIKDENNTILYKDNIKGRSFSKWFSFNIEERNYNSLRFEIMAKPTNKIAVFVVDRIIKTVEYSAINRVE